MLGKTWRGPWPVDATDEPLRTNLAVFLVLAATDDTRAQEMLELAPGRRAIVAAWEQQGKQ